jgi:hypothetical protein
MNTKTDPTVKTDQEASRRPAIAVERAVDRLVSLTTSEDETTRDETVAMLRRLGPYAVERSIAALRKAKVPDRRLRLMEALAKIGVDDPLPAAIALYEALSDHVDAAHREAFMKALGPLVAARAEQLGLGDPGAATLVEQVRAKVGHRRSTGPDG